MHEAGNSPSKDQAESTIADVTRLPLGVVFGHDGSVLDKELRRVLRDMERPGENYAAHGSTP